MYIDSKHFKIGDKIKFQNNNGLEYEGEIIGVFERHLVRSYNFQELLSYSEKDIIEIYDYYIKSKNNRIYIIKEEYIWK